MLLDFLVFFLSLCLFFLLLMEEKLDFQII